MDLVRLGRVIRALRRRRGWRQSDLAARVGVSQSLISLVERGHGDRLALRTLLRMANALDARMVIDVRWRAGELDRLLDEGHAALEAAMAARLRALGWVVGVEVTYAIDRSAGSIDVLAWHEATGTLLVIEIKTEITSAEATLRKLDEKVRLGPRIGRDRFGWTPRFVSKLLVIEDTTTSRRRVQRHDALFQGTFPARGVAVSRWLRQPTGALAGVLFLAMSNGGGAKREKGGFHRVRRTSRQSLPASACVDRGKTSA